LRIFDNIFPSPFAPFAPVTFQIGPVARQPLSQLQIENFQFPILNSDGILWLRCFGCGWPRCVVAPLR
jgi:hypothetical protein